MRLTHTAHIAVRSALILFLLLAIGCQGVQKTVLPGDRIALMEGGPHPGSWDSKFMSLDYQYFKQSAQMKLSVQPKVKSETGYAGYKIWALFVDAQGNILEEKSIAGGENTFVIPPGTTALAFRTFVEPKVYKPPVSR